MTNIKYPVNFADNGKAPAFKRTQQEKVNEMIDAINSFGSTSTIPNHITDTTDSSNTTTGALVVDGGVGIAKNLNIGGYTTLQALSAADTTVATLIAGATTLTVLNLRKINHINEQYTLTALNSTGPITAIIVAGGGITSTSASPVTATLDTATNISTAILGTAGIKTTFIVDNTLGSDVVTVAINTGITVITPIITGSDTLTVAAGTAGEFKLYFSDVSTAVLSRVS